MVAVDGGCADGKVVGEVVGVDEVGINLVARFVVALWLTVLLEAAGVAWIEIEDEFWHLPSFPGRQLSQFLPSLVHEQFLQLPVRLQRQQVISVDMGI